MAMMYVIRDMMSSEVTVLHDATGAKIGEAQTWAGNLVVRPGLPESIFSHLSLVWGLARSDSGLRISSGHNSKTVNEFLEFYR